jgi:hypothetical protein
MSLNVVPPIHRRAFLGASAAGLLGACTRFSRADDPPRRLKVAAICTEFRYRGHAHVILENFLEPYLFNGEVVDPTREFEIASMYLDQIPQDDMGRGVAKEYGIRVFETIPEALRLGGDDVAVDAVLSIGEHGRYPRNAKGQVEYPRKRFFDAIAGVVERSGRAVPVFNDKHLSYRWDWANEMVETARRLKMPFMAGSSVPLAERRPPMEIAPGVAIREAVSIHGGPLESYDFHGLEVLQAIVEARAGGETGVKAVRFLEGDALWKAADEGLWSIGLADGAMAAELGPSSPTLRDLIQREGFQTPPHGILLDYSDGLRAIVLRIGSSGTRWNFACRIEGEASPRATRFHVGPWENRNLFKALAHAIQAHFRERRPPYPVERTLLTTGALDAAMDSRIAEGKRLETPWLAAVQYEPTDFRAMREMGETWRIVTEDAPQPKGIDLTGRRMLGRGKE